MTDYHIDELKDREGNQVFDVSILNEDGQTVFEETFYTMDQVNEWLSEMGMI